MDLSKINKDIPKILKSYNTIAVVGLSPKPYRDSHKIAKFMIERGRHVIPVNPGHDEILGLKCYPSLIDIPEPVELVDIFRNPEHVEPIIDDAIACGAKAVWMQLGVVNEAAAAKALDAGLEVVMDHCWKIEYLSHSVE